MSNGNTIKVSSTKVWCGSGEENHPIVYINLEKNLEKNCPYCNKKFIYCKNLEKEDHDK